MKWTSEITAFDIETGEILTPYQVKEDYIIQSKTIKYNKIHENHTRVEIQWHCQKNHAKQLDLFGG